MHQVRFFDYYERQDDTARATEILDCIHAKLQPYGAGVNREAKQIVVTQHSDENSRGLIAEKLNECGEDWRHHLVVRGITP